MVRKEIKIVSFSNRTGEDRKLLREFVDFHWRHYRNDPQYIPLLDYEYLGSRLLGIIGFFEPRNFFFKHAEATFFLARPADGGEILGRCCAFINHRHNDYWKDKTGFFGQFEAIDDEVVSGALLSAAEDWLRARGMKAMRGPQNFPVNEATPGLLTAGYDSRPVIYYPYNMPYYEKLLGSHGLKQIMHVLSWEIPVMRPMEERLARVAEKVIKRELVTLETWDQRPLEVRKKEMLKIYNEAWAENFGFVPFLKEGFDKIIDDMQLVFDKNLFVFAYVRGEPAGFFGGVLNILEKMRPIPGLKRFELLRAAKMFLSLKGIKGFRLGYLGVRRKFRHLGLVGILLWKQKIYSQAHGYQYSDIGWVLEDNEPVIRLVEMMPDSEHSKTYTIFQKPL